MIQLKFLGSDFDLGLLSQIFNTAFSDYILPMALTSEQLALKLKSDLVDLDLSIGAFDGELLVGFVLVGRHTVRDKKMAYCASVGVIPSHRGLALTKSMYEALLYKLKENDFNIALLECIIGNEKALKIYQDIGFQIRRRVSCYEKGTVRHFNLLDHPEIRVLEASNINWGLFASYWDFIPTWQNDFAAIQQHLDHNKILGIYIDNILVGYLIGNVLRGRIFQIAIHHSYRRRGLAKALLNAWLRDYTSEIFCINVPKEYVPMQNLIYDLGLRPSVDQYEMSLEL